MQSEVKEFYIVWCEWDIGQHNKLFISLDDANRWIENSWDMDDLGDLEEAKDLGLITIEALDPIKHTQMTTEKTEVNLTNVYGTTVFDYKGASSMMWQLSYEAANEYCDGEDSPIMVETFEGSNVHLEAVRNGEPS